MRIKFLSAFCLASLFLVACNSLLQSDKPSQKTNLTDRERDGLVGGVKAVLTDDLILDQQAGRRLEKQQASSTSIYDESGKLTKQTPFRVALQSGFAITQHDPMFSLQFRQQSVEEPAANQGAKWIKKYDENGLVTEATRYDAEGKQVERIVVSYGFDHRGNWVQRLVSHNYQNSQPEPPPLIEMSVRQIIYFDAPKAAIENKAERIPANAIQMKSPIAPTEENLARGGAIFNQKCAACHGENGKSDTPFAGAMAQKPADLTGEAVRALSEGEIYSVISNGKGANGMPAFGHRVPEEALWQIALYVRKLSRAPSQTAPAAGGQNTLAAASPKPAQIPPPPVTTQRYPFKGKVVSVDRESREVTVSHEEIKGYMGAMTMSFPLNDENALGKIKKDDQIEAILIVDAKGWRLEKVVFK